MKLDKRQITALAHKFYDEIKPSIDKANKENKIKALEKFRGDYDKGVKLLKDNQFLNKIDINIGNSNVVGLTRNTSFEKYTQSYSFNYVIKDIKKDIKISDIEQNIILATIDSSSIDDIMKTLKSKYK